jgi:hypothetical protein
VLIGDRYSAGPAAAILAEGLGWEFVPVQPEGGDGAEAGPGVGGDRRTGPGPRAWAAVARQIVRGQRDGSPWHACVLLPPSVLYQRNGGDRYVLDLLADTPASIVYTRPPQAFLTWRALRQQGALPAGTFDAVGWIARTEAALHAIEGHVAGRGMADLMLDLPEPGGAISAIGGATPDVVADTEARVAWTLLCWLDEVTNRGCPPVRDRLLPGALAGWILELSTDPDAPPDRMGQVDCRGVDAGGPTIRVE